MRDEDDPQDTADAAAPSVLRVNCADVQFDPAFGDWRCSDAAEPEASGHDALLLRPHAVADLLRWPLLGQATFDTAVVVLADADPATVLSLLRAGVQDVLPAAGDDALVARAVRLAIERKRLERGARTAYATDLATGLLNHGQLLEHMTHLLALREREPAPMALLVLRIEGLARTGGVLGPEAANVLRRKAAVRLRAGLRASDVVAAIGGDAFAVLLSWIDAPPDGDRVAAKLAQSLAQPYSIAGRTQTLAVRVGLALYPDHGKSADALLIRAVGQAASVATVGAAGVETMSADRGPAAAANDEDG